jgi:hypothetical protein
MIADFDVRPGQRHGALLQVVAHPSLPPAADGGRHGSKVDSAARKTEPVEARGPRRFPV